MKEEDRNYKMYFIIIPSFNRSIFKNQLKLC